MGKVRAYSKKAHHFDLNIPRGQIESLCYMRIPKESGRGREQKVGGQECVWLIAINYHTVTGTARVGCKGDRRLKRAGWSESIPDSDGLTETQERGDLEVEQEGQNKQEWAERSNVDSGELLVQSARLKYY